MSMHSSQSDETSVADLMNAPVREPFRMIGVGGAVSIAMAVSAVLTSYLSKSERVATTAWVVAAIVGTASIISSASAARHWNAPGAPQ